MKLHYLMMAALCFGLVSGCAQRSNTTDPALGGYTQPTGRVPSPGNAQGTAAQQSRTMAPPIMTY